MRQVFSARMRAKRAAKEAWWVSRGPTTRWRALPDFLVIGAQKSGTTSLYSYLIAHPEVRRPFGQEPAFFSDETKYGRGIDSYRRNFPVARGDRASSHDGTGWITGEASGEYLYYPTGPDRIADDLPDVRLLVVLRDPVERTVSAYFHNIAVGYEAGTLTDSLGDEIRWHTGELEFWGPAHRRFGPWGSGRSLIGRGLYARHLRPWLERFGPERIKVIEAETMFEDPTTTVRDVADFLGIDPAGVPERLGKRNTGSKEPVRDEVREWLGDVFTEPNRDLQALLDDAYGPGAVPLRWAATPPA